MRHLQRVHPELHRIAMEDKEDYTVERVLSIVIVRQMVLATVKWLGWGINDTTREPVRHFKDSPHFVYDFFYDKGLDVPPLVLAALHGL